VTRPRVQIRQSYAFRATQAEGKLAELRAIFDTTKRVKIEGHTISESSHAYYNLEGAIIDIEREGRCDATSLRTLKRVGLQLARMGKVLFP